MIENPKNFEENNQIKPATDEESGRVESGKTEAGTHKGRKFFTILAIAATLAATSCDSIPSREEMAANRIARKEMRAAQRAAISANEMTRVKSQINAYLDTYDELVDKYDELVSEIQPGQRNLALENDIRLVDSKITDCEKELNKLSEKHLNLSYTVSTNSGGSITIKTHDKDKYKYLRKIVNESN